MKYILIFFLVSKMFGSVSVTAEFDSLKACKNALDGLIAAQRYTVTKEPHSAYLFANCFTKGGDGK